MAATVAVLLIAAAALLVAGVFLERHAESGTQHSVVATSTEQHAGSHDESAEGRHAEGAPPASDSGIEAAEQHTGIGVESPLVVALGTVAAVALAVIVWRRPSRPVIATVVAFTAAAVVLDVLEIKHQAAEGRTALVLLATFIVAIRVTTVAGCGYLYRANPVKA